MTARLPGESFANILLIHAQRPDATLVQGYGAWQAAGRQVGRSEQGIQIFSATSGRLAHASRTARQDQQPGPAVPGRRFCSDHAAELDRMREELKDAAAARIGRGRPKRSSTCCRPGCYEPRVPPAAYCDACSAAGYVEEAA